MLSGFKAFHSLFNTYQMKRTFVILTLSTQIIFAQNISQKLDDATKNLMNSSISLIVISNNSANTIAKTLKSVDSLVDEIILIDTGITDSTLEIAGSFNPKIFSYKWENNFSKARNYGIEKASGKWILILDTDEYIHEKYLESIRYAVEKENKTGIFLL